MWYYITMLRFNENNEIIQDENYRGIIVGLQLKEDIKGNTHISEFNSADVASVDIH